MSKALSVDLRRRVVDAVEAGSSCRAAAARFGVGVSSAIRWVARSRSGHSLEPGKRGGNNRSHRTAWFEGQPDLDPERLVFIDESGTSTKMARLYGRAPRRLQPDRTRLLENQSAAEESRRAHRRRPLGRHPRRHRLRNTRRLPELLHRHRLRTRMIGIRSRY